MRCETGLRRSKTAVLEKHQYKPAEAALRDVKRIKTGTVTKFFPLSRRDVEIVESRLDVDSPFLFSTNGKPNEGVYRMLKNVCTKPGINYGAYQDGGFMPHDLRRNFATNIIEHADTKTVAEPVGHSSTHHTQTYLRTTNDRMIKALKNMTEQI